MKLSILFAITLTMTTAQADESGDVTDRLVDLARSGCDYLRAHAFADPNASWSPRALAGHFGRIKRTVPNGITRDYYLELPRFPGWKVIYEARIVTVYLPESLQLRMAELVKRIGAPTEPDVDHARPNDDGDARSTEREWIFPAGAARKGCWIRATTDGKPDDVSGQRILTFSFQG
jgi:hypothetical protein